MDKPRSATEELISLIMSMTPEQIKKLLKHPTIVEVMGLYGYGKT